jgi:FlaA1/EpsC-like NDP-sugar epimerase
MLQRDRLIRTQVQQLADASLFAMSFWLAYCLRGMPFFSESLGLGTIPADAFENMVWIFFALVPAAPLVLESQGFYNRPVISRRPAIFWPLLKSCFFVTLGLVLLVFLFKKSEFAPRGVMVLFGVFSFVLVWR